MGRIARDRAELYSPVTLGIAVAEDPGYPTPVTPGSPLVLPYTRQFTVEAIIEDDGAAIVGGPATAVPYTLRWFLVKLSGGTFASLRSPSQLSSIISTVDAGDHFRVQVELSTRYELGVTTGIEVQIADPP